MDLAKLNRLRSKAQRLSRERFALIVFSQVMTEELRRRFELEEEELKRSSMTKVRQFIAELEVEVAEIRRLMGAKEAGSELVKVLTDAERAPSGKSLLITKSDVRKLFSNYHLIVKNFCTLPDHARIEIDPGIFREQAGTVDWFLLEARIFEDMCALFNLAKERCTTLNRSTDSKRTIKTAEALCRAAGSTAFYCVEAYLNGLAFDFYTANEPRLGEDTKRLLTEWDAVQKKPKPVGLRDKLLQYPRIICGTAHPPLQENNCPEMAFITGRAKLLRDAVVHASPKPNLSAVGDAKESLFLSLDFPETERIVDNTVALIRKIEIAVHGDESRIGWLCSRGPNGLFPDSAFD